MITLTNSGTVTQVAHVIFARYTEKLDGTLTLDMTLDGSYRPYINDGTLVYCEEQYFDVSSISYSQRGTGVVVDVTCEHVSYRLNESVGEDGLAITSKTPQQALASILSGSDFTADDSAAFNVTGTYTFKLHGNMYRRNGLYQLAALCSGEIYYSGWKIGMTQHRGSTALPNIINEKYISDVDYTRDVVNDRTSVQLVCRREPNMALGDNVQMKYDIYGLNLTDKRIIGLRYDPYNKTEIIIDIGDYVPDLSDYITDIDDKTNSGNNDIVLGYYSGDISASGETAAGLESYKAGLKEHTRALRRIVLDSPYDASTISTMVSAANAHANAINTALTAAGYTGNSVSVASNSDYEISTNPSDEQYICDLIDDYVTSLPPNVTWYGPAKHIDMGFSPAGVAVYSSPAIRDMNGGQPLARTSLNDVGGFTDPDTSNAAIGLESGGFWVRNTHAVTINRLDITYYFRASKQTGEEICYG